MHWNPPNNSVNNINNPFMSLTTQQLRQRMLAESAKQPLKENITVELPDGGSAIHFGRYVVDELKAADDYKIVGSSGTTVILMGVRGGAGVGSPTIAHTQIAKHLKKKGGMIVSFDGDDSLPRIKSAMKRIVSESSQLDEIALKYKKVKDLNDTQTLWAVGDEFMVVSYSSFADETAVFRADKNGKVLSYSELWSGRGLYDEEKIIKDIATGKIERWDKLDESTTTQMWNDILRKGIKLGDWLMQSYFYYQGNIWMLKDGKITNDGPLSKFRHNRNRGLITALEPKLSEVEKTQKEEFPSGLEAGTDLYKKVTKEGEYLGYDKKFRRSWYNWKGYLYGHHEGSNFMFNNGSIEVKMNQRIIKGLIKSKLGERELTPGETDKKEKIVKSLKKKKGDFEKRYGSKAKEVMYATATKMAKESFESSQLDEASITKEKFKAGVAKWFSTVFYGMPKYPTQGIAGWKTELKTGSGMPGYITYILHNDGLGKYTVYIAAEGTGLKTKIAGGSNSNLGTFKSPEDAMRFVENHVLNEELNEGAKEIHKKLMQKGVVAPIDKDRYPERKGLEGPYRHKKSGKVFYYDPKEGKYYDADSDIYLDVEDVMESTLDEALRSIHDVKPTSKEWKSGILSTEKRVEHSKNKTVVLRKGDKVPLHPFDGDRWVSAIDVKDPGTYFFIGKSSVTYSEMKNEEISIDEGTMIKNVPFTTKQIAALKAEYSKINRINPDSEAYKKLIGLLDMMSQNQLKQIYSAGIKFLSKLAWNRIQKNEEYTWDDERGEYVRTDGKDPIEIHNLLVHTGSALATEVPDVPRVINSTEQQKRRALGM